MKTVLVTNDYYIGDAGGEGSRFIAGNQYKVMDEIAAILIGSGAAQECKSGND